MRFDHYMDLALYHPVLGYYSQDRARIGYAPGTDFYTASTSGAVFGELVSAASSALLGARPAADFHFVEVGAEPGRGVLSGVVHPFASYRTAPLRTPLSLEGPCVVFSNELFDAQPCRRFVKRSDGWREVFVRLDPARGLLEEEREGNLPSYLPENTSIGYRLDAPEAAAELLDSIVSDQWWGLFLAFDYGKSWEQLATVTPQGTARAYFRHTQTNDLLARPGRQDLTCHVCWDWLALPLQDRGFGASSLETQEAFFIGRAGRQIELLMTADSSASNPIRRSLMQLLHPTYLGQKFEVLHAFREPGKIALDSSQGRSLLSTL